ncbi:DNA topoisomerase 3 [Leucoagaricus sp. SymC.cos]|nr:DNA topoisomerase 3 [Leucoagaricus sp. SymC.cos]
MIGTDCDREGEHIGMKIATVCRNANRTIVVKRARFSAIIARQIHRAAQHPVELDHASRRYRSTDSTQPQDGAAFTRMQTLSLQNRFQVFSGKLVSYGPCQFPTLGFVVQPYNQVKNFVTESFQLDILQLDRSRSVPRTFRDELFSTRVEDVSL